MNNQRYIKIAVITGIALGAIAATPIKDLKLTGTMDANSQAITNVAQITLGGETRTNWPSAENYSAVSNAALSAVQPGDTVSSLTNDAGYLSSESDPVWAGVSNTVTSGAAAGATAVQPSDLATATVQTATNWTGSASLGTAAYSNSTAFAEAVHNHDNYLTSETDPEWGYYSSLVMESVLRSNLAYTQPDALDFAAISDPAGTNKTSMTVAGFGTNVYDLNGVYTVRGTHNGKPYYAKPSGFLFWETDNGGLWAIHNVFQDVAPIFYSTNDVATPNLATSWETGIGGSIGTVTSVAVRSLYSVSMLADSALQPGASNTNLVNDAGYLTAEADTLASVSARGATTASNLVVGGITSDTVAANSITATNVTTIGNATLATASIRGQDSDERYGWETSYPFLVAASYVYADSTKVGPETNSLPYHNVLRFTSDSCYAGFRISNANATGAVVILHFASPTTSTGTNNFSFYNAPGWANVLSNVTTNPVDTITTNIIPIAKSGSYPNNIIVRGSTTVTNYLKHIQWKLLY